MLARTSEGWPGACGGDGQQASLSAGREREREREKERVGVGASLAGEILTLGITTSPRKRHLSVRATTWPRKQNETQLSFGCSKSCEDLMTKRKQTVCCA
jgi:hypothetical protein